MLCSDRGIFSIDEGTLGYTLGSESAAAEDEMANQKAGPRYRADITAGSLKVTESRRMSYAGFWVTRLIRRRGEPAFQ